MGTTKRQNGHLSDRQLKALQNKLLGEKEKIINRDADQAKYYLDKNELSDPVDEASINIQASHELRFRNRENFFLKKIDKALLKFNDDSYGLCDECASVITFERLNARPTAELCIGCKEEAEMEEKSNFFHLKSKSLGKTLNEIGRR
jgi:DnaK suppressor protein